MTGLHRSFDDFEQHHPHGGVKAGRAVGNNSTAIHPKVEKTSGD
jgi:hypothetical protein